MEVSQLSEIYRHAMTEALQIPCQLDDATIQRVHQDILQDLRKSANDLVNSGVLNAEEVSMELDFNVGPILEEAKSVNRKRKYAFFKSSTAGRYTCFLRGDYTIISGQNNDVVISDIRNWLCDFGTEHDRFAPGMYGHWSCVGKVLENVKSSLTVARLLPRIFTKNITSPEMPEPTATHNGPWNAAYYIQVHPIEMKFYFNNPTEVTGEMKIKSRNVSYKLQDHHITLRAPVVQPVNTLDATVAAEIEYDVSKRVYTRMWAKIITFGIANAFDNEKSTKFVHKMKIKMSCDPAILKLREQPKITMSKEAADKFLKSYKAYQEMGPALAGNKTPEAIANSECQSQPWVEVIQAMKDGDVKDILMNIPVGQTNVARVAVDELLIETIMAEAVGLKVPMTLNEGDGRGASFFVKFLEDHKTQLDRIKELRREIGRVNMNNKKSLQHELERLLAEKPNANTKIRNIKKCPADTQADITVKDQELGEIHDTLRSTIKKDLVMYKPGSPVKALLKDVAKGAAVGAAVDGIITLVVSCDNEIRRYYRGEITTGQCVWEITNQTGVGAVRGAGNAHAFSGMNALTRYATMAGWRSASALTFAANAAGPVLLVGSLGYQTYAIMDKYRSGDLTTAQMEKAFAGTASTIALSTAGMIGAACLIGGPAGLVVGAGLTIAVGIADHFLGDKIWSIFITEDIKALEAVDKRKRRDVTELVLKAGYELFDLSEYATDEELRESYRAAILKYHPDKGGNAKIFAAVHAAYTLICEHRTESLYQ